MLFIPRSCNSARIRYALSRPPAIFDDFQKCIDGRASYIKFVESSFKKLLRDFAISPLHKPRSKFLDVNHKDTSKRIATMLSKMAQMFPSISSIYEATEARCSYLLDLVREQFLTHQKRWTMGIMLGLSAATGLFLGDPSIPRLASFRYDIRLILRSC